MADKNRYGKKKRKKWPIAVAVAAAAVLAVMYFGPSILPQANAQDTGTLALRTAAAQKGNIEVSVVGSGVLSADDGGELKLPGSIEFSEVSVEAGDRVSAGDVLAYIDMDKLASYIDDTRDAISDIDSQIKDLQDDAESKYLKSPVAGRVKEVNVSEGEDLTSKALSGGAAFTLSLDGKMKAAVNAEGTLVAPGDEVTVTLSDGTEEDGDVVRSSGGVVEVTLTDNGPLLGGEVTVSDSDGNVIGKGVLEINTPLSVLCDPGVVSELDVEENEKVSSGGTLLTLTQAMKSRGYGKLLSDRADYEELLRTLYAYESTGVVTSDRAGMVSEVPEENGSQSGSQDASDAGGDNSNSGAGNMTPTSADSADGVKLTLLSAEEPEGGEAPAEDPAGEAPDEGQPADGEQGEAPVEDDPVQQPEGETTPADGAGGGAAAGGTMPSFSMSGAAAGLDSSALSGAGEAGTDTTGEDAATEETPGAGELYTAMFKFEAGSATTLVVDIDELDILSVKPGQTVEVVLDALPNETFTGTITKISAMGTTQSGVTTYPVTIKIQGADERLLPGMNASVTIVTDVAEGIVTIPLEALQEMGGEKFVFIAGAQAQADGSDETQPSLMGERRVVTTGLSDGVNVEVTSGLTEGEQITYINTSTDSNSGFMGFGGMGGARAERTEMVVDAGGPQGEPPQGAVFAGPAS